MFEHSISTTFQMTTARPPAWHITLAFAALYLIWGSTYLGIKVAIESMPPFLMATARFLAAGIILYAFARSRGAPSPTRAQWVHSTLVGGFLIAGGNGFVSLAEQSIDSSMAALVIASNPFFMALFGWWGGVQKRPGIRTGLSLVVGFIGVATLISSGAGLSTDASFGGYVLIMLAVIFWTAGSIYSKRNPQAMNPRLQSGMQMICGGLVCLIAGGLLGEFSGFELTAVTNRSWVAFSYLLFVGSLAGFTSYVFLLNHCSPSAVSSHAYVNPVVAVFLGWLVLGESLHIGGYIGSALILLSVYELLRRQPHEAKPPSANATDEE